MGESVCLAELFRDRPGEFDLRFLWFDSGEPYPVAGPGERDFVAGPGDWDFVVLLGWAVGLIERALRGGDLDLVVRGGGVCAGDRSLVTGPDPGDLRRVLSTGDSATLGRFTTNSEHGFSVGTGI